MTLQQQQQIISSTTTTTTTTREIEIGLNFILSHFDEPFLFPRKIATYKSNNKQFLVRTKEEIIGAFGDSNFIDSRMNAYPSLIDYQGIPRHKPNFIFIDLDRNYFKTQKGLELAL